MQRHYGLLPLIFIVAGVGLGTAGIVALEPALIVPDTDGDGIPNDVENQRPSADPLHKDVYIEVSYAGEELRPSNETLNEIRGEFASAPVENPDGTSGIDVHIDLDDTASDEIPVVMREDEVWGNNSVGRTTFDNAGDGYHHIVITQRLLTENDASGLYKDGTGIMAIQDSYSTEEIILHELGHALGISSRDVHGVDSFDVPYEQYPSVMNYNRPLLSNSDPSYSNGTQGPRDHNDWREISKELGDDADW